MSGSVVRVAWKTAQDSFPKTGNRELFVTLDFSATTAINDDLSSEMRTGNNIESIQSVYIDNSLNAASISLQFNNMQTVTAQPFTQGIYPVIAPGAISYVAITAEGIKIPVIFSNTMKRYSVWGPTPGVNIVPPLTNANFDAEPLIAGDNVLVAAVGAKSVKLYRAMFSFGGATIVKFTDGSGGAVLMTQYIAAGGSITLQPSGIAWLTTSLGNALILNSSQAVNGYGGFGYVQS